MKGTSFSVTEAIRVMPPKTTTPTSRIIPMKLMTESRSPVSASSPKEPAVISGSENMTVRGWMKDSNWIAITM